MTCKELQEEELEVLRSIYDGDNNFKELSPKTFQYMVGEHGDSKSFLLEVSWGEQYPNAAASMNLDAFYNKHLLPDVKRVILEKLLEEAVQQIGTPMTYTLLELAKEKAVDFTVSQPDRVVSGETSLEERPMQESTSSAITKKERKPKLTKQQKRRLADKLDSKGEHPRGWDWVDVIKHLSQCGPNQMANDINCNS